MGNFCARRAAGPAQSDQPDLEAPEDLADQEEVSAGRFPCLSSLLGSRGRDAPDQPRFPCLASLLRSRDAAEEEPEEPRGRQPGSRPLAGLLGVSSWLRHYSMEVGHPPGTAEQLCAFAANRGLRLAYSEAQSALRASDGGGAAALHSDGTQPVPVDGGGPGGNVAALAAADEGIGMAEVVLECAPDVEAPHVPVANVGAAPALQVREQSVDAHRVREQSVDTVVSRQPRWDGAMAAPLPVTMGRSVRAPRSPPSAPRELLAASSSSASPRAAASRRRSLIDRYLCNCGAVCTGAEVLVPGGNGKALLCLSCAELSRQRSAHSLERLAWPASSSAGREPPPQATVVATVGPPDVPSPTTACTPDLRVSRRGLAAGGHDWACFSGCTPSSPSDLSPSAFSQRTSFGGGSRAESSAQASDGEHSELTPRPPKPPRSRSCSFESFALPADMRYGLLTEAIVACWRRAGARAKLLSLRPLQRFARACHTVEGLGLRCGIDIVFHWTRRENLPSIAEKGLLVADGVETPVVHGRRHGPGVYASPLFHFGRKYGDTAVLCLALPGRCMGSRNEYLAFPGEYSSLQREEIVVYKNCAQLLPCAVVFESELAMMFGMADDTRDLVVNYFPGLKCVREVFDEVALGHTTSG